MKIKTKIGQLFQLAIITSSLMGSSAWATLNLTKVGDYYQITSADDLKAFADEVNNAGVLNQSVASYNAELTKDIDASSLSWTPIGSHTTGVFMYEAYKGTFKGNGHTITGLTCTSSGTNVGLFGYIYNATIDGVNLVNSKIECTSSNNSQVAGICGWNKEGTISNCSNLGTVTGKGKNVAGICGYNESGTITNCSNSGAINGSGKYVGGINGYNSSGTITNCSNSGIIIGSDEDEGGICGHNTGTIINVYNTGSVKGDSYVGGVCGSNETGSVIKSCYSTGSVSGTGTKGKVFAVVGYNNATIDKASCYYLSGNGSDGNATPKVDSVFKSGELAILLQMWVDNNKSTYSKLTLSNWTQINGTNSTNKTPAFGDNGIEYVRANTSNNWGTLCLPYVYSYTYDSSTLSLYDVKEVVNSELVLSPADSVTPGKPVVYYYTGADDSLKVTIPSTKFGTVATLTANNSLLNGVYEYSTVSGTTNYYLKDDVFYKSAGSIIANPFRAYVTVPAVASAPKGLKSLALSVDNNASNDSEEEAATVTESHIVAIYNINGQQVGKMDRGGIYVVKMSDGSTKKVRITE